MAKSFFEKQEAKMDRFLETLTSESEFFGMVGRGYTDSFYKVYVRSGTSRRWWLFETGAGPVTFDPIKEQAKDAVPSRVAAVWAPLSWLVGFKHDPEKHAVSKLFARAAELRRA